MSAVPPYPDRVVLDWMKMGLNEYPDRLRPGSALGPVANDTLEFEVARDLANRMYARMTLSVLRGLVVSDKREFVVEQPSSWWQHFKLSHFPKRLRRRFPPRFGKTVVKVDFTRYATYPMASLLPHEDFGSPVFFDVLDTDITSEYRAYAKNPDDYKKYANRRRLAWFIDTRVSAPISAFDSQGSIGAEAFLNALERFGINPDQLVTEDALRAARF